MHRKPRSKTRVALLVGVIAAAFGLLLTGGASAIDYVTSPEIKDGAVHSPDLADGGTRSVDIRDGGVHVEDLGPSLAAKIDAGINGQTHTSADTTVVNVGGTFGKFTDTVRATLLDTVTLEPGVYALTGDGFFHSTAATSGQTRMQLALRVDDGTDWGQDFGTCFTGNVSELANREATCQTTRVVEVTATTDVGVYGFGYADDQGSADSGKVNATSYVTAVKLS